MGDIYVRGPASVVAPALARLTLLSCIDRILYLVNIRLHSWPMAAREIDHAQAPCRGAASTEER